VSPRVSQKTPKAAAAICCIHVPVKEIAWPEK
jgi:hypothetical protein